MDYEESFGTGIVCIAMDYSALCFETMRLWFTPLNEFGSKITMICPIPLYHKYRSA